MIINKKVYKSKSKIRNAFMLLSAEKELKDITITELSALAKVNRATFYLHYEEIYDVLDEIKQEIYELIDNCMIIFDINYIYVSIFGMFKEITNAIDKKYADRKSIIFSQDIYNIPELLKKVLVDKITKAVSRSFPNIAQTEITYPATFIAGGVTDCYINWVQKNDNTPIEPIIGQIAKISEQVIQCIIK